MPYHTHADPAARARALTTVAVLHLAAGYLLVTGLAARLLPHRDQPLTTTFIPDPPKPRPTEDPPARPHDTRPARRAPEAPRPRDPLPTPAPTFASGPTGPIAGDGGVGTAEFPQPLPSPSPTQPRFPPIAARPHGAPAEWITPNDYPGIDLRAGHEGTVRFRLEITAAGRVASCVVTGSSGWSGLDAATCAVISRRARFAPASDQTGAAVPGSFAAAVRWAIPE